MRFTVYYNWGALAQAHVTKCFCPLTTGLLGTFTMLKHVVNLQRDTVKSTTTFAFSATVFGSTKLFLTVEESLGSLVRCKRFFVFFVLSPSPQLKFLYFFHLFAF